ncbi:hypothetical protein QA633_07685 [Bradyrhizobium barranii]|uniref:hypothetical protein n=1 Tax=Bradyrhizobium barranii TaxID=2992140 RepID=UPI0024B1254D|nr:hypothetical protein [Bradyrhizobium barranii]WFT96938.1 hypothetical protein QA633_07685 [Bradyrhizobium barranii]
MSIVPRRRMQPLSEGKDEQARAEQREPGRGQCQEATGNKVMIAHEMPSIAPQKREQQSLRHVLDQSAHKLIFKTSALFLLLLGGKAFFQRGYGSHRRLAAEIKKPRMRTAGVFSASAFAALRGSVRLNN